MSPQQAPSATASRGPISNRGTGPLLKLDGLTVRYGGVTALEDVSFEITPGTLCGLIGPNGAGKTSLIDAVTGYTPIAAGTISFSGTEVQGLRAYRRARLGLARTFQSVELFDDLSVEENLIVASERTGFVSALGDLFRPARPVERSAVDWAISTCGLAPIVKRRPREISHGQRKLVGVARALAQRPKMLLLDEPAAGLDTDESAELGERLRTLPDEHGLTLLLIDHDMDLVLNVCDDVHVLDFGRTIAHGSAREIQGHPRVIDAYLGRLGTSRVD